MISDNKQVLETYVLTCDLGERVEAFRHIGLNTPEPHDAIFCHHQKSLHDDLQRALSGNCDVVSVSMRDLADEVISEVNDHIPIRDVFVVSTCPEIASPVHGEALEINRIYTIHGEKLGVGPRSGYPPLRDQLANIASNARDKQVVLVEDGIFSGGTLRRTIDLLWSRRIRPKAIVAGFAFPEAEPELDRLRNEGVEVILAHSYENLIDWMPDHDFVPFVPGCGRVVGVNIGAEENGSNGLTPLYTYNHASYSFPYILPFVRSPEEWQDWTGIPSKHAKWFSANAINRAIELFKELEALNSRYIHIADIVDAKQRPNVPIAVGQDCFPHLDTRILSYLYELL